MTILRAVPSVRRDLTTLGGRLTYARRRANLTQAESAITAGLSLATVGRYERGEFVPPMDVLERLAVIYEVEVRWLTSGVGQEGLGKGAQPTNRGVWPPYLPKGRYYLVCPACGRDRLRPDEILQHLQSPFCLQVWTPEEAEEHARRAQRDPAPWFDGMRMRQARIEQAREDAARAKGSAKETIEVAIQAMAAALNLMRVSGPERFEIPESERY